MLAVHKARLALGSLLALAALCALAPAASVADVMDPAASSATAKGPRILTVQKSACAAVGMSVMRLA